MEAQKLVQAINYDGAVTTVTNIMAKLIVETVENCIKENDGDFDFSTTKGIEEATQAIAYYIELAANEKVTNEGVSFELHRQLTLSH